MFKHKNTQLVCRKFESSGCALRKKVIFSSPGVGGSGSGSGNQI
jgi:hypothetical protein